MALRTRYSSLDMVRMAKFAKENPNLKPIPLIVEYNKKHPEVTTEQKLTNIRNWLDDNKVMAVANADNECAALPLQNVINCPFCGSNKTVAWGVNNDWSCLECKKDFEGCL